MIKLVNCVGIDASAEAVWKALSDLESVTLWVEPIVEAYCSGDTKRGVGATRACKLKGNMTIREEWIAWDEGNTFTYVGYGMPFIKSAKNTWSVRKSSEDGQTLLMSEAEIEFKGGALGKLLEFVMGSAMRRIGPRTLAAFKYWVENGHPFKGRHSSLQIIPVAC